MSIKSIFLPNDGLQGEKIPSHILWDDIEADSIVISFQSPLIFKEGYNATEWDLTDNKLTVQNIEVNGYLGLVFESEKTVDLEKSTVVEYSIFNGDKVFSEKKEITLFKPLLNIESVNTPIRINPDTGYVSSKIVIKNIGLGTLILELSTSDESDIKNVTPIKEKEFQERFEIDFLGELKSLKAEFPSHSSIISEIFTWEGKTIIELTEDERRDFMDFNTRLSDAMASNNDFLQGFIEAIVNSFLKNTEIIDRIHRMVKILESLVSKNILLINPFDVFNFKMGENEVIFKIKQTDRILDDYDDVVLDKLTFISESSGEILVYKLFDWV